MTRHCTGPSLQRIISALPLLLVIAFSSGTPTQAASFDCEAKELKPDEKLICDTRSLNDADVRMVTTFELLSGLLAMGSRGSLQDEQSAWLKDRQSCGADPKCLGDAYTKRMSELDKTYQNLKRPL